MELLDINSLAADGARVIELTDRDRMKMWLIPGWRFPVFARDGQQAVWFPEISELYEVEKSFPWNHPIDGYEPLDQFKASFNLLTHCERTENMNQRQTASSLKHDVERVMKDLYINQDAFARAAFLAGFELEPVRERPTYRINILTNERYFSMIEKLASAHRDEIDNGVEQQRGALSIV